MGARKLVVEKSVSARGHLTDQQPRRINFLHGASCKSSILIFDIGLTLTVFELTYGSADRPSESRKKVLRF
jgi:hypothetical protein